MMQKIIFRALGARINAVSLVAPNAAAQMGFNLFCKPPKPVIRPKEQRFLAEAVQQVVNDDDLHYLTYAWGPATAQQYFLLAYGWGYNAGRWRHFVPQLVEAGYKVIAFDPPGHGHCPGNHLNLHLNSRIIGHIIRLEGKPQGIIAHSFGGSSSILALEKLDQSLHPETFALMASFSASQPVFLDFATTLGLRSSVLKGMIQIAEGMLKRPITDLDMAHIATRLGHIESLIVHDPTDPVTPFAHAERYANHWPGSELLAAQGAGHHLGLQEVTNRILQHVLAEASV